MKLASFHIRELDCAQEIAQLREGLGRRPGVASLQFDLMAARLDVTYDPGRISPDDIRQCVQELGMHAVPWNTPVAEAAEPHVAKGRVLRVAAAFGILLAAFLLHGGMTNQWSEALGYREGPTPPLPVILAYLAAVGLGLWEVAPRAARALRMGRLDMHVLVCMAAGGAVLLGNWLEAGAVSVLFGLAILLEQASIERARHAITALLHLEPTHVALRRADGEFRDAPLDNVQVSDIVLIRPGDRIPVDGHVLHGASTCDESPLTGEFLPVSKNVGDPVYAGSLNYEGALEVRAERPASDSTMARIIRVVRDTQAQKAPWEGWVEKFARRYTPAVFAAALLTAVIPPWMWRADFRLCFYNALVLLVIACPCALVISTPVSFVSALACAARRGVLVKGGQRLEACAGIRALAIDKTGTLTIGRPTVESFTLSQPEDGTQSDPTCSALPVALALANHSRHPLSQAIGESLRCQGHLAAPLEDVRELPGKGVQAVWQGRTVWLGGTRLVQENGAMENVAEEFGGTAELGNGSMVWLGQNQRGWGRFHLVDRLRHSARAALEQLQAQRVQGICLVTGDRPEAAARVAAELGITDVAAAALPEDKLLAVHRLRSTFGPVMMVGDGINDSPALASADVGVAMGAAGSDQAIETADVALMSGDLQQLAWLVAHARRTLRIVRQNIGLALGLKGLVLLLAAAGWGTLWLAVAADMGASLLVIGNALRLLNSP